MREAKIADLIEQLDYLLQWRHYANQYRKDVLAPEISSQDQKSLVEALDSIAKFCLELGLEHTSQTALWASADLVEIDHQTIYRHADAIYASLVMETSGCKFLKIDATRADYYPDNPRGAIRFAKEIEVAFPGSVKEILSACRCFAVEEWPASVFHCMRALEQVLRELARKFFVPCDDQTWHNIIEGIEAKVRGIGPDFGNNWKEAKSFYGEAARHLFFIKESWRNHIMHIRDEYDEGKAFSILQHSREFADLPCHQRDSLTVRNIPTSLPVTPYQILEVTCCCGKSSRINSFARG